MHDVTYLDMLQLSKELKRFEGARIEKFYSLGDGVFRFKISQRGEQQIGMVVKLCGYVCTSYMEEKIEGIDQFTSTVRKHISGTLIGEISMYHDDRILLIKSMKGENEYNTIIEMFGKGNLIIADRSMRILAVYSQHVYSDRAIKVRETYLPPISNSLSPSEKDFGTKFLAGMKIIKGKDALRTASRLLKIGSPYVSEAFARAGIPSDRQQLDDNEIESLASRIMEVEAEAQLGSVYLIMEDGKPIDYMLCKPHGADAAKSDSGLLSLLSVFYEADALTPAEQRNEKAEELEKSIEKQLSHIRQSDELIAEYKKMGEAIFNNMVRLNQLIQYMSREKRATIEELQSAFPDIKVLSLDKKSKMIKVDIDA